MSIETLKLFEALLNLPHEQVLRNLIFRNLDDRAYFNEPAMTNGEISRSETCDLPERSLGETPDDKDSDSKENGTADIQAKESKDNFFDKQKIEKLVNGLVNFLFIIK